MTTIPQPKRLSSGYYRIQLGPQCWAQWPHWEPLRREHIFDPDWHAEQILRWYKLWIAEGNHDA